MNNTSPAALDFPALDGRPVTQGHANLCLSKGHAVHTVDGVPTGVCPRCGDVTDSPAQTAAAMIAAAGIGGRFSRPRFLSQIDASAISAAIEAAGAIGLVGPARFSDLPGAETASRHLWVVTACVPSDDVIWGF